MPSLHSTFTTITYTRTTHFPSDLWRAMGSSEVNFNVILPHAQKTMRREQNGLPTPPDQYWISLSSTANTTIDFVLACTTNDMDTYPIFIATTLPFSHLTPEFLHPRMSQLANALLKVVPTHRVFSVFAPEPITRVFCGIWTELTGIRQYKDAYYHADITYCTAKSFRRRQPTLISDDQFPILRLATINDLAAIGSLCRGFSLEGEPFVLEPSEALEEARSLIQNRSVWVYAVSRPGSTDEEIATLCAFTRTSDKVSTISKVYTHPNWRSRGCAERLVRRVCQELLKTKESVALYVAHSNAPANKVYHKVGFVGLWDEDNVEGVDPWIEIGFDRTKTVLGYW